MKKYEVFYKVKVHLLYVADQLVACIFVFVLVLFVDTQTFNQKTSKNGKHTNKNFSLKNACNFYSAI